MSRTRINSNMGILRRFLRSSSIAFSFTLAILCLSQALAAQDAADRVSQAKQFHYQTQQRTGLIIPLYRYPADIHTNDDFNRVIELKREHDTIPFWVIVNPATGPGEQVDQNYVKAIDRLQGAGCVVLGYVSTEYGKRDAAKVEADLERWQTMYPRVQGVFFDEMIYEEVPAKVAHQKKLKAIADKRGFWPVVANPGTDTPEAYFKEKVADVILIHESEKWPEESKLHGNYFGGYSDYPNHMRGVLVHSMKQLDPGKIRMIQKYAKWIYVTQDEYRIGDPKAPNPWDVPSVHIDALCKLIESK